MVMQAASLNQQSESDKLVEDMSNKYPLSNACAAAQTHL
jgi:hypothetical protein